MSIQIQILGNPGADNATFMHVDSGSSIDRLLFDCGEGCLDELSVSEIQSIDHLFFSHFHMDHVCGFDTFFRLNYNRPDQPVTVWGPPGTIELIHHRMLGYTWNLHQDQPGEWVINELVGATVRTARFYTREAFAVAHETEPEVMDKCFFTTANFAISCRLLNHGTIPSIAYRIDEPIRENVDAAKLGALGLAPGPWIKEIKDNTTGTVLIGDEEKDIFELRRVLLGESQGGSAAYLTDFILNPGTDEWAEITQWIGEVDTLVCEAQFRESDNLLAENHSHMTTERVGKLAQAAKVGKLIVQHVSRRYDSAEWLEMLAETRSIFPNTDFPVNWQISISQAASK